ncbi:MAG: ATP-dependent Clp protease ATP-binding subunit [Streptococcus sp.]|nr:MAG: ATP-dependent Clp protease ATP-binding subunit [Streptococcus sp.]
MSKQHKEKSQTPYLDKYTEDLTAKVRRNIEDFEAYGRGSEIKQVFVSLVRLHKNSPTLVGEAGVGKTHIVEGVCAAIIRKKNIPKEFENVRVRSLSLSAITSKTRNQNGEEEDIISKLHHIVEELKAHKKENILFIDEVHTIMGTGATDQSTLDVANLLKPALSRGDIYFISATTHKEFRLIEKDSAMERRLQPIYVEEPDRNSAIQIMSKVKAKHERVRGIEITDEAIIATVDLSTRYMADKNLPDKSIDLLDEAVASAYLNGKKTITYKDIAKVVHIRKGIDLEILLQGTRTERIDYEEEISKVVKGQKDAVKAIADITYRAKTDMQNKNKPLGTILLLGTTGVGKTECARQTARAIFGSVDMMTRIDCSEYNDDNAVARLIGSNGNEGTLTEKVKRKPYQVLLFDEIEKGSPSIQNLLLQVMDAGRLTDGNDRLVNFKNVVIFVTTNVGHETIKQKFRTLNEGQTFENLDQTTRKSFMSNIDDDLSIHFRPEFINRFDKKVVLNMLTGDVIQEIITSKMKIKEQQWAERGLFIKYVGEGTHEDISKQEQQEAREQFFGYLQNIGTDEYNGARPLERTIENVLDYPITRQFYFLRDKKAIDYTVEVALTGTPPHSLLDGSGGKYTVKDRRTTHISLNPRI